jgi:tripartite-type tricarboxylate transporter receptor subunit TctC
MRGMKYWSVCLAIGIIGALAFSPATSVAQPWPQRAVRIIVPVGAGGGPDLVARLFSLRLAERWNHPVIVENRPGADGLIGTAAFVTAHDDHTLLYMTSAPIAVYPVTRERLPYDPGRDVVPISSAASGFFAVSASAASKIGSLGELVKRARSQPGKLNYNSGVGQLPILFDGFLHSERLNMVLVSYRDMNLAVQDLAQGRLDVMVSTMTTASPAVNAGKARYLAITNETHSPIAPEVETAVEAGYPELAAAEMEGFFGWRDIPPDLRDRISADIQAIAADPALSERLAAVGYVAGGSTPAKFGAALEELRAKIASIAKLEGIKPVQ